MTTPENLLSEGAMMPIPRGDHDTDEPADTDDYPAAQPPNEAELGFPQIAAFCVATLEVEHERPFYEET